MVFDTLPPDPVCEVLRELLDGLHVPVPFGALLRLFLFDPLREDVPLVVTYRLEGFAFLAERFPELFICGFVRPDCRLITPAII